MNHPSYAAYDATFLLFAGVALGDSDAIYQRYFLGVFAARYALLQASAIPIQAIGLLAGQLLR